MDSMVLTARKELEIKYREIKEEIKKMKMNDGLYYKELVSIFECDSKQEMNIASFALGAKCWQ